MMPTAQEAQIARLARDGHPRNLDHMHGWRHTYNQRERRHFGAGAMGARGLARRPAGPQLALSTGGCERRPPYSTIERRQPPNEYDHNSGECAHACPRSPRRRTHRIHYQTSSRTRHHLRRHRHPHRRHRQPHRVHQPRRRPHRTHLFQLPPPSRDDRHRRDRRRQAPHPRRDGRPRRPGHRRPPAQGANRHLFRPRLCDPLRAPRRRARQREDCVRRDSGRPSEGVSTTRV
jgi:hypothetical protein